MRTIRYAFLAVLGVVLITIALANRAVVTIALLPEDLAEFIGQNYTFDLPMFAVIFAAIIAGILLGFVWEWLREYKHRSVASKDRREKERLAREVKKFKVDKAKDEGDEVLALLDN